MYIHPFNTFTLVFLYIMYLRVDEFWDVRFFVCFYYIFNAIFSRIFTRIMRSPPRNVAKISNTFYTIDSTITINNTVAYIACNGRRPRK